MSYVTYIKSFIFPKNGNHTLFFCNECRAKKVYAFEPVKKTYKILKRNIVLNQLQDKVITYNSAPYYNYHQKFLSWSLAD